MKVVKLSEIEPQPAVGGIFRGPVTRQAAIGKDTDELRVHVVNFGKGGVNVFHTHTFDQVLFVTDGEGIVATEQEETRVGPGTFIFIPAGEKHWHGATPDTTFSHIAINPPGVTN